MNDLDLLKRDLLSETQRCAELFIMEVNEFILQCILKNFWKNCLTKLTN